MPELLQLTQLDRLVKKSLNRNILVVRLVFARVCYDILTHRIVSRFFPRSICRCKNVQE